MHYRLALFIALTASMGALASAAPPAGRSTESGGSFIRLDTVTHPHSIYGLLRLLPERLDLPEPAVARMRMKYEALIRTSRYMEKNAVPAGYPGWEGFPLIKCRYDVKDADGTVKQACVIMLNPSAEQLARWTVACCLLVHGSADSLQTDRILTHIRQQSGAQFPISGIVYEDMEGDGKFKIYCFRDGVTAKIKGIQHAGILPLDEAAIDTSLYGTMDSTWTGQFARIQSTNREQYAAIGGPVDVGDKDRRKPVWLEVVRDLYQVAWKSDVNILLIAWAYAKR
ncbi:MAG: hypothetical protein ACM3Q4_15140 [Acidobacteriota bacterium]